MKMFLLFIFIFATYPAFATEPDIPTTTASCADAILKTNGGTANIEINWEPNVIPIRWYNGNTLIETNTCTYGGELNIPNSPQRTGYTFRGWRVRPQMDFSTIPTNVAGIEFWSKSRDTDGSDRCHHGTKNDSASLGCTKNQNFSDLQQYEWKASFTHGMVYGMAKCSSDSGTENQPGNPSNKNGKYCWCKVTGYRPTGQTTLYGPSLNMHWMYNGELQSSTYCSSYLCARYCAQFLINNYNAGEKQRAFFTGS